MSRKRLLSIICTCVALGLTSEVLLWQIQKNDAFIAILAPVLTIAHFAENYLPFLKNLPALQNELVLIFPLTLLYFGGIGFWISKILTEEGFLKFISLVCFVGFIIIIHGQAYSYFHSLLSI